MVPSGLNVTDIIICMPGIKIPQNKETVFFYNAHIVHCTQGAQSVIHSNCYYTIHIYFTARKVIRTVAHCMLILPHFQK